MNSYKSNEPLVDKSEGYQYYYFQNRELEAFTVRPALYLMGQTFLDQSYEQMTYSLYVSVFVWIKSYQMFKKSYSLHYICIYV
jgi:hypothetical protein